MLLIAITPAAIISPRDALVLSALLPALRQRALHALNCHPGI